MLPVICLAILVLLVVVFILVIVLVSRRIKEDVLPPGNIHLLLQWTDYWMRLKNWETRVNYNANSIHITRDSLIASIIYFRYLPDGRIEILSGSSCGILGWILVIVLVLATGLGGVIVAIVFHFMSRSFAKNEIVPYLVHQVRYTKHPR